jgi:selenocysteine-specific translation elongation factor
LLINHLYNKRKKAIISKRKKSKERRERERERIHRGLKNDNTKTNIGATNVTNADQIEELRHYQQLQ